MELNLEGLTVERIVVHTIPKRNAGKHLARQYMRRA